MRLVLLGSTLAIVVGLVVASCGSSVTQQTSGTVSGSGASGTASSTGASSSGGVNGACGAFTNYFCEADHYCSYAPTCGGGDSTGVCKPKPTGCEKNCLPVCGCDNQQYCNPCFAAMAGVDVTTSTSCLPDAGNDGYSATPLFTNIERFAIFKIDAQQRCLRLIVAMTGGAPAPGMSLPAGWLLERAELTNTPSDCALQNGFLGPAADQSTMATGSTGQMAFPMPGPSPQSVTAHGSFTFTAGGWIPASETVDFDALPIQP